MLKEVIHYNDDLSSHNDLQTVESNGGKPSTCKYNANTYPVVTLILQHLVKLRTVASLLISSPLYSAKNAQYVAYSAFRSVALYILPFCIALHTAFLQSFHFVALHNSHSTVLLYVSCL